jgi:hypothetical protein
MKWLSDMAQGLTFHMRRRKLCGKFAAVNGSAESPGHRIPVAPINSITVMPVDVIRASRRSHPEIRSAGAPGWPVSNTGHPCDMNERTIRAARLAGS